MRKHESSSLSSPTKIVSMQKEIEENPFVDESIARAWAESVEGESGMWRDTVLYPAMRVWLTGVKEKEPVILDIGSGQGRASNEIEGYKKYVGVEPSEFLVRRARDLYTAENREFHVGDAYHLPVENESINGAISVNVFFHLADVERAIKEIARVLKIGGSFFINTADNDSVDVWKTLYANLIVRDTMMEGALAIPVSPLSRNTFYFQPNQGVIDVLQEHRLYVEKISRSCEKDGKTLFLTIEGRKV
jgi:SAM-dependent methyltransferase